MSRVFGVCLQLPQHLPAVHTGHQHVQCDGHRVERPGQTHALLWPSLAVTTRTPAPWSVRPEQVQRVGIVVHHQYDPILAGLRGRRRALGGGFGRLPHLQRQPDREGRALAFGALHRDVAAHHLTEAPADRQAEPGAPRSRASWSGRPGRTHRIPGRSSPAGSRCPSPTRPFAPSPRPVPARPSPPARSRPGA